MGIRDALKQRAVDVGFDLVGVAPANPGADLAFAREWLRRGHGGEMAYLSNPKRLDPSLVLPSIKSVICVGLIYDTPFPYSTEVGNGQDARAHRGWIARYAWGRDYHEIMREKLEKLRASTEELAPGTETRVFADTGPVSERAFARFSGLGWMGKNTCIINEETGSWFFLGVILTNLALAPDLPAPDRCGSCTACLDACPTSALVESYIMDASRCVSYLTIELKGSIPIEFRPAMGANVFGCDICQDVCPWNGKNRDQVPGARGQESAFLPMMVTALASDGQPSTKDEGRSTNDEQRERLESPIGDLRSDDGHASSIQNPKSEIQNPSDTRHPAPNTFSLFAPPLAALASMTEDDFRQAFRHSPIKRAKYRGWQRNLCVAMGNSGDPRFLPKLRELAAHAHPVVREHAEWALAQIQHPTDS